MFCKEIQDFLKSCDCERKIYHGKHDSRVHQVDTMIGFLIGLFCGVILVLGTASFFMDDTDSVKYIIIQEESILETMGYSK